MKICRNQGNGVCLSCDGFEGLKKCSDEICRNTASERLDLLYELLNSALTTEQEYILEDYEIEDLYKGWNVKKKIKVIANVEMVVWVNEDIKGEQVIEDVAEVIEILEWEQV